MAELAQESSPIQTNSSKDFQEFDDKTGVKGLVDSGISKIPEIFVHRQQVSFEAAVPGLQIPIIDLESVDKDEASYKRIAQKVLEASVSWGVFQVVNHGMAKNELDNAIEKAKEFHEGNQEVKKKLYSRDQSNKLKFISNLVQLGSAIWCDSLICNFNGSLDPTEIPLGGNFEIQRRAISSHRDTVRVAISSTRLASRLLEKHELCKHTNAFPLLPPLSTARADNGSSHAHRYILHHVDPTIKMILVAFKCCMMAILVDVTPVPGALIVIFGDLLKCFTNEKFKSAPHHVLASKRGRRISVSTLVVPALDSEKPFGPLKLLLSDENPPLYKEFLIADYMKANFSKKPNTTALSYYKI